MSLEFVEAERAGAIVLFRVSEKWAIDLAG